jgi:serine/threonine protein kinase/Flp pilus assembly protein TadD
MTEHSIFFAALDIDDPAERGAYLDRACGADGPMRRRVDRLLKAHTAAGQFLQPLAALAGDTDLLAPDTAGPPPPLEGLGSRIGPYTLLHRLGEGGMGAVYLAEQERPVRRQVALKVIKPGMDSEQVVARFEAERQALALMDHAHIAKVLDAGTTEAGRPYFVMELVRGAPITRYCDDNRLSLRERLELFVPVCHAVQHAHQKGVVHRDLKPSNVLVALADGRPVPKVIDFGVAKALEQRLTDKTFVTGFGQIVGTLEYMAPEQARLDALDVDTRSDVYALGAILYELLTATTPFERRRLRGVGLDEGLRIIREEGPPAPSARLSVTRNLFAVAAHRKTEPGKLHRLVRVDLDRVVMKCLEKDRARRYETANGLAQDIQRYLNDEPVSAGPPSAAYRLRKFVRRNRRWLAPAAALAVALVLGTGVSAWQAVRATRAEREAKVERDAAVTERKRADEEAAIAQAVSDFITDDILRQASAHHQASPTRKPDPDLKVRTALDRAAENIAGKFAGQPRVEVALRDVIGRTYWELGEADKALTQLEAAVRRARAALGPEHHDTLKCLSDLASVYQYQGQYARAEPLFFEASELSRKLNGPEHPDTLTFLNNLGLIYQDLSQLDKAEPLFTRVLELRRQALGEEHADTLTSANNLAGVCQLLGQHDRAARLYARTLEVRLRVLGPEHPDTLTTTNNLGLQYRYLGRYAEAEPLLRQALQFARKMKGEDHLHTLISLCNVGLVCRDRGKYAEAEALLTDALRRGRTVLGGRHPSTLLTANNLACLYQYQGRYAEAEALFTEAIGHSRQALGGDDHNLTFTARRNLALLYLARRRHAEAERLLAELLPARRRVDGPDHPRVAAVLAELGESVLEQGRAAEAEPLLREALTIRGAKQFDNWVRCSTQSLLGACLTRQQRYAEAEPLLLAGYEGLKSREATLPAEARPNLAAARERLVRLYEATGWQDKAAKWRQQLEATKAGAGKSAGD